MSQGTAAERRHHLREYWLNARRARFWVVLLLLLYTLAGFFGLPWLLRTNAIEILRTDHGRELRIADIRTNPFTLTLVVDGFELDDRDGEALLRFDRLLVDFTPRSLFNWAWTFETVDVDGLVIHAERFESGETRLGRLLGEFAPGTDEPQPAQPGEAADDAPPRLVFQELRLDDARLDFIDHLPAGKVEFAIHPIDIRFSGLDTRPQREGSQSVRMVLESGGTIDWQGMLQPVPFRAEGQVEVRDVVADGLLPYLQQIVPLRDFGLVFDTSFEYRADLATAGPNLRVSALQAELRDLAVSAFEPETEFLSAESIRVEEAAYSHPERALRIGAVRVEQPRVTTWLTPNGEPGLLTLLPEDGDPEGSESMPGPAQALSLALGELQINGLDLDVADRSTEPPAPIGLRSVALRVESLDLQTGSEFPTRLSGRLATGGSIAFNGRTSIRPVFDLLGDLRVEDLDLALAQPYLARIARARFDGGVLDLDGRLAIGPDEPLAYRGAASITGLDVVDATAGERVLGWKSLQVDRLQLALGAGRVQTSLITIEGPFASIAIAEDRSTNIGRLLGDSTADAKREPGPTDPRAPLDLTIEGLAVRGGEMDFADRSLPLPFKTRVTALEGRVTTVASGSTEPARITLEGQVDEYGFARVVGTINTWQPTLHTDIRLEFNNLEIPEYSPYTVQFAGRRIAAGRMDLDLGYRIDEGRLEGSNDLVLRDLELGERVASPDAADLPLGLAVALLKDRDGVIDITLPVSGDVNDPQFGLGSAIRQALITSITSIVTSPFRFLASLVGFESEDFGTIEFLPARADLTPPQREKIAQLVEALARRPELVVRYAGVYDPAIDRPALQQRRALDAVRARLERSGADPADLTLSDEAAREPIRELFVAAYPEVDLDAIRESFATPPADDAGAEPVLDAVAFHAHLARRLAAAQDIAEDDLTTLATARAQAVRNALLAGAGGETGAGLPPERVVLDDPQRVEAESDQRVALEITLASD